MVLFLISPYPRRSIAASFSYLYPNWASISVLVVCALGRSRLPSFPCFFFHFSVCPTGFRIRFAPLLESLRFLLVAFPSGCVGFSCFRCFSVLRRPWSWSPAAHCPLSILPLLRSLPSRSAFRVFFLLVASNCQGRRSLRLLGCLSSLSYFASLLAVMRLVAPPSPRSLAPLLSR